MFIPAIHIPIWGIPHVHDVVDGQLLPLLDPLHGANTGYKPKAGMLCICPAAVGREAVVQFVCKSGSVGGVAVVLGIQRINQC